jgi:protein-tyrosine phosphatase
MHPAAARLLRELGADADGFRSRELTAEVLASADLVLTATREQRAICVSLAPASLRRSFTMRQFGRLSRSLGPSDADGLMRALTRARSELQPVRPEDDDIPDPVLGTEVTMRECFDLIRGALRPALRLLTPAS